MVEGVVVVARVAVREAGAVAQAALAVAASVQAARVGVVT